MNGYPLEDEFGNVSMIYDRKPYTDWVIHIVNMYDESEMEGFYRTARKGRTQYEQFTLLPAESYGCDDVLVQIRIYKNGNYLSYALGPANIVVYRRKKIIKVELYFKLQLNIQTNKIEMVYNLPD